VPVESAGTVRAVCSGSGNVDRIHRVEVTVLKTESRSPGEDPAVRAEVCTGEESFSRPFTVQEPGTIACDKIRSGYGRKGKVAGRLKRAQGTLVEFVGMATPSDARTVTTRLEMPTLLLSGICGAIER